MKRIECITDDDLELFLSDRLPGVQRDQLESHLSDCRACRRRLVNQHLGSRSEEIAVPAPDWLKSRVSQIPQQGRVRVPVSAGRWRRQFAVAATIVLALSVGFFLMRDRFVVKQPSEADVLRQETGSSPVPQLFAPKGGAQVQSNDVEFRWSEVYGAERYALTLLNEKGDIVFETSTVENRLSLSAAAARLEPGKTYFWYVRARLSNGTAADSAIGKFGLSQK